MSIKKLIQTSSAVAMSSVLLSACGGGGGDGKKGGGDTDPKPSAKIGIQGTAMKGIMKKATVEIFSVENGVASDTPIDTIQTDDNGLYTFQSNHSGPILVKVSGDEDAMMTCDIAEGCDSNNDGNSDIAFGADFRIGETFTLEAVSNIEANKAVTINVTPLTNLSAKQAKKAGISVDSIASANSQVANLFDLTGDITKIPTIDITKADQVKAADKQSQKNAVMASSLYAAAKADNQSLNDLASAFANQNGQLVKKQGDTEVVSLEEIYTKAKGLLDKDELKDASIKTDVDVIANDVVKADPGEKTDVKPSDEVLTDGMKKVQAMVQDLRNIGVSSQLDNKAKAFGDEFEVADQLLSDDLRSVAESLGKAVDAIRQTKDKVDFSDPAKTFVIDVDDSDVSVTVDKDVFTVKEPIDGVDVDLVFDIPKDQWQRDEVEGQEGCPLGSVLPEDKGGSSSSNKSGEIVECNSGTSNYNALIKMSGSVKNDNVEIQIKDGSIVELVKFDIDYTDITKKAGNDRGEDNSSKVKLEKAKLDLKATITQLKDITGVVTLNSRPGTESNEATTRTSAAGTMLEGSLVFELAGVETTQTEKEDNKYDTCLEMTDRITNKKGQFCGTVIDEKDIFELKLTKMAISFNGKAATNVNNSTNLDFAMEIKPNGVTSPDDVAYRYESGSFTPYLSPEDVVKNIDETYPANEANDGLSAQNRALLESFRDNVDAKAAEIYQFAKNVGVDILDSELRSSRRYERKDSTGGIVETSDKWADASFSFSTDLKLDGVDNDAEVSFSGKRTGYRTAEADVTIAFDDKRYTLTAPEFKVEEDKANDQETFTTQITITNQNSVNAIVDYSIVEKDDNETETLTGVIQYDGTKYADIERKNNMTLIRYTNGQVESLE